MISHAPSLLVCTSAMFIWVASPSAEGDLDHELEETVGCDAIPVAVWTAFQKLFPKATLDRCTQEEEMGKSAYELTSSEGEARRDTLFYPDGRLIVVEERISAADLPESVLRSWDERYANDKIILAEKVMRGDTVTYEIQSLNGPKPRETVFDGSGRELKTLSAPKR